MHHFKSYFNQNQFLSILIQNTPSDSHRQVILIVE